MRRSLARLLGAHGYATEVFASAEAFLRRDPALDVTCIVVDIHLDGMTGIGLRCHLQASAVSVPVIFITGINDAAVEQEAMRAGCIAYLAKPFPAERLIGAVEKALVGPRSG